MDGGLPLWQPAFCFPALSNFVTAGDPALKCWGAHLFERQLDFLCCLFSPTLYVLLLCTSLSVQHSHYFFIGFSAPTSLLSPPLHLLFCLSVSLSVIFIYIRHSPNTGSWTKPAFLLWLMLLFKRSETCLRWIAFSHNHSHEYISRPSGDLQVWKIKCQNCDSSNSHLSESVLMDPHIKNA